MLTEWKKKHPGRIENIFRALANVSPSQLADRELFDFASLGEGSDSPAVPADWLMPDANRLKIVMAGSE
jgi:tRNA 2-thiocytidine biosynthesis protein TtcA